MTLDGGADNDTIESATIGTALGGTGDDLIITSGGVGGSQLTLIDGGAGFDELRFSWYGWSGYGASSIDMSKVHGIEKITGVSDMDLTLSDVNVSAGETLVIVSGDLRGSRIDGSAELDGHLNITGSEISFFYAGADTLIGGAQSDTIKGLSGDDTLRGNGGNDALDGGAGLDTAVFAGNFADYTITPDNINGVLIVTDTNSADGDDGTDTLKFVNRLQFADQTIDVVVPGITLVGTNGDDNLQGTEGNDNLNGGSRNDTLAGLLGDDILLGGDGDDTLTAAQGNDTVDGGTGNDLIVGGHGEGDDSYNGGDGIDTVAYSSATQGIVVNLSLSQDQASGPEIGTDQLVNIENVVGGSGNDQITGDALANRLTGGPGNDTIDGGAGINTAVYSGLHSNYRVTPLSGSLQVVDTRSGSPDGSDTVSNIQNLQFSDGTYTIDQLSATRVSAHDFGGDGKHDFLWRSDTGTLVTWDIDDGRALGSNDFGVVPNNWHIVDTGDFNGDAKSDLLWRSDAGTVVTWDIDHGHALSTHDFGVVPNNWHII